MLKRCKQQECRVKKPNGPHSKIIYDKYIFSGKEWIVYGAQSIGITGLLGFFFYGSVKWIVILVPLIFVLLKRKQMELTRTRKQDLLDQFKDMLVSLNNAVQAGYALENAIAEAYKDMKNFYREDSLIVRELAYIRSGMMNGKTPEEMLEDLGERSKEEDIRDFANVLVIGKRSGGNINEIIKSGITVIEEKIDTKQKIRTLLSARTFEAKIMSWIPFFIIFYVGITSEGYFDVLYLTMGGHVFMTLCLIIYLAAVYLSEKIINIEI